MRKTIKKLLYVLIAVLCTSLSVQAQNYSREGKTFQQVSNRSAKTSLEKTDYTWVDSKGISYPVYISKSGKCYVKRISKNTGKEYNYKLPDNVCKEIANELGIKYQPTKKQ